MTALRAGQATDVGLVRANNQDQALVATPLFAVADGMGGHAAGEVASATACEALADAWAASAHTPEALVQAARLANKAVFDRAQANPEMHGMGTTLVAVALTGETDHETVAIAHVGDSRVYRLHDGEFFQVTNDHSLVAELVAEGQLAAEDAERHPQRHVLSRALGVYPDVEVDLNTDVAVPGDRFLLCSDGLSREVTDNQISAVLRRLADPTEAAQELVETAKAHGGADNITVVVVDLDAEPAADGAGADGAGADGAGADGAGADGTAATPMPAGAAAPTSPGIPQPGDPPDDRHAVDATGVLPVVNVPPAGAAAAKKKQRIVTVRFVAFILALVAVVAIAFGIIDWYARNSYYVGLQGQQLVIFQGRPGGVLWFNPTVKDRTGVTTAQIESRHLGELHSGMQESSLSAAKQYVTNLVNEEKAAQGANPMANPASSDGKGTTTTTFPGSASGARSGTIVPNPIAGSTTTTAGGPAG